ncbi:MAG: hypothetical protein WCS14_03290 [Candidatus Methanomethylophilaceae archaeon]
MGSKNRYMSCSFGSRVWMKLKREVGRVTDDVMSLSRDFKYDFLKVRPDVFEPRVVDRQTFKKEVSCKDTPRPKHKPTAVPMQDVYADAPPSANNGQIPLTMMWPADEEFVPPGVMPAADLGDMGEHSPATAVQTTDARGPADRMPKSPTMEFAEEITMVSSGPEPMGTTSVPIGYESPYIRALMADTSTEAIRSDGYVFDFDYLWDEEEEEVAAKQTERTGEYNFVIFDLSEPAEVKEPNLVIFDLSEPAVEKTQTPNFILVYPSEEAPTAFSDEGRGMMELTIPGVATDSIEMEDAFSEEVFTDDDANLAPMLGEDRPVVAAEKCATFSGPAIGQIREQPGIPSLSEGVEVSFGFLSGASEAKGESGIDFVFGTEECQDLPAHNFETQTSRDAVKVSSIQTQRMYL